MLKLHDFYLRTSYFNIFFKFKYYLVAIYLCCNLFNIYQETCTISYNAIDQVGLYAVAIQIEDFINSASTEPLSSVPLQFIVDVSDSDLPCSARPVFVQETPTDDTCIGIGRNDTYMTRLVAFSESSK